MVELSLPDVEAEALIGGSGDVDGEFEAVADLLATMRDVAQPGPDDDFSSLIAAAAGEARATPMERFALEHAAVVQGRGSRLVQRLAIGGVALLVVVTMSTGMAYASDGAKPGDALYGLDRALEALGIGDGAATERLREVEALIATGAVADGLRHAREVLDGHPGNDEARLALETAATRLQGSESSTVPVQELIDYLYVAVASGAGVDGPTVTGIAQRLGTPTTPPEPRTADPASPATPADPPTDPASPATPTEPPTSPGPPHTPTEPPTETGNQGSGRTPATQRPGDKSRPARGSTDN